jgi:hypothetical protein
MSGVETLPALSAPAGQAGSAASLCKEFRELSAWTWAMLATAADADMPCQEETITDFLLLQLAARCPGKVKVIPFPKRQEAKVGADWEWWFCDWPDGVGFRVQAKRLFAERWYFNSLKFPTRGRSQTDILIEAAGDGVVPLYCFYVFQSRKHHSPGLSLDRGQGCRLMRADTVARIKSKLAKNLMPDSVPWHDIVCDDECGVRSLEAIASWANELGGRSETSISRVQTLPRYVEPHVLEKKRMPSISAAATGWRDPGDPLPSIRGIVTINVHSAPPR